MISSGKGKAPAGAFPFQLYLLGISIVLMRIEYDRRKMMRSDITLQNILDEFTQIAMIPRPSHHEEKIAAYLCGWAERHGLPCVQDELGNVIIDKPASPGCERAPKVILQAHMDMVCVAAAGVSYDPLKDPIRVKNDGTTLTAEGTSLGADDGIGIALILYLLSDCGVSHGPLRALFTVNEEDGMTSGAIDPKYLDGAYLINLDWEWLGSLCNSSAGGDFMAFSRNFERCPAMEDGAVLRVELADLLGGHSGVDIHRGRANALTCMAGLLLKMSEKHIAYQLLDFSGGQARNAIPASAGVSILVKRDCLPEAQEIIGDYGEALKAYYGEIETGLKFRWEAEEACTQDAVPDEAAAGLLRLILTLPNGVHTMSPYVAGLVESSQNLGLLETGPGYFRLSAMERSCSAYRAEELLAICKLLAETYGFVYQAGEHSPAWEVNPRSRLTPLACEVYRELTGDCMVVEPVHGALECGAFFEKNPNMDMIAIGPSLLHVHTPKETCDLRSVQVTAELIAGILRRIGTQE